MNPEHTAREVRDFLTEFCHPLPAERITINRCHGRVLAGPVTAADDMPPFDRSSVDGYAVRADDAGRTFRVVGRLAAGSWSDLVLRPGEAVQIATGAALPGPGLRIVMREHTREGDGRLSVSASATADFIRRRGEEARAGQELIAPGTRLNPANLALAESIGQLELPVARCPRVAHVVTGDEIVPPEDCPRPGQVRDANSGLVRRFLEAFRVGFTQVRCGESGVALRSAIDSFGDWDLLIVSGGSSVGEGDHTLKVLEELGCEVRVRRTRARPGRPLLVATHGQRLAMGLPGNPLSHFACLHLYVRRALESWSGQSVLSEPLPGRLAEETAGLDNPRETFWPAEWVPAEDGNLLSLLPWSSSGDLTPLARANALAVISPHTEKICAGGRLLYLMTDSPR